MRRKCILTVPEFLSLTKIYYNKLTELSGTELEIDYFTLHFDVLDSSFVDVEITLRVKKPL